MASGETHTHSKESPSAKEVRREAKGDDKMIRYESLGGCYCILAISFNKLSINGLYIWVCMALNTRSCICSIDGNEGGLSED
jgi:hypothetical protein